MCSVNSNCKINDDDLQIRLVTVNDYQRVLDFMDLYFSHDEPLSNCGSPQEEPPRFGDGDLMSFIEEGTCLMASLKVTDKSVAVAISLSQQRKQIEDISENPPKSGDPIGIKIEKFLTKLEHDANLFERYNVERILYLITICVSSDMRGRGIGGQLCKAVCDLAKRMDFDLVAADCTSFYSAIMLDRLGWSCENTVYYKDYCDAENNQVFKPPLPHEYCKTYAYRL